MFFPSISRLFCAKKGRCLSNGQGELSSFSLADDILFVTFLLVTLNEWTKITPPRRVIFPHNNNVCRVPESNGVIRRFLWISCVLDADSRYRRWKATPGNSLYLLPLSHFVSHIINAMPPCPLPAPKEALEQNAINNISVILSTLITTHLGNGTRIYTESEKF